MTNGNGEMVRSGGTTFRLPSGAVCLAFEKSGRESEFEYYRIGQEPLPLEKEPFYQDLSEADQAELVALLKKYP